ncbi:hypothetical protein [Ornithinimicrobium avium]|uniref:hypothetical protein n=1 Tax=Ornithinimicrobium avium TaxID=2283195 RepID=UPI0013B431E9|nr:hypothetical protein [Ornithinimicrobium avium]
MTFVNLGLAGLVGYVASGRRARQSEARAARSAAVTELRVALRALRDVARRWGRSPGVLDEDVRAAVTEWDQVLELHRHRLPHEMSAALRSVRSAAGEVFGISVLAYVLPQFEEAPLVERDETWQDLLVEYVGYVLAHLGRWGDGDHRAGSDVLDFDRWRQRRSAACGEAS